MNRVEETGSGKVGKGFPLFSQEIFMIQKRESLL